MINNNKKTLPILYLLPTFFTLLSLAIGTNAIRLSIDGHWEKVVYSISFCALLDTIDGRVARLLEVSSQFGAELDSLADFISFGVSPSIAIYLWIITSLNLELKKLSWAISIIFIICSAIRLARFNIDNLDVSLNAKQKFFTGIPSPAAGLLLLLPIIIDFKISSLLNFEVIKYTHIIHFFSLAIALMMASRIPTFSFKNLTIRYEYIWLLFIILSVFIIVIVLYTWYVLPMLLILYLFTIPFSIILAKKIN